MGSSHADEREDGAPLTRDSSIQIAAKTNCSTKMRIVGDADRFRMQIAVQSLLTTEVSFNEMPSWLGTVAEQLPMPVRTRRDWPRFLSLLQAIALTRMDRPSALIGRKLTVDFSDYAIAYRLLNVAFSQSPATVGPSTAEVVAAAAQLYRESGEAVSVAQISEHLGWEYQRTYKHVDKAVEAELLSPDNVVRQKNEKRLIPTNNRRDDFLLSPQELLKHHPELTGCQYVDPITGEMKEVTLDAKSTPKKPRPGVAGVRSKWDRLATKPQSKKGRLA